MGKAVRAGAAGTFWKKRREKSGAEKRTADLAEEILQPVFRSCGAGYELVSENNIQIHFLYEI